MPCRCEVLRRECPTVPILALAPDQTVHVVPFAYCASSLQLSWTVFGCEAAVYLFDPRHRDFLIIAVGIIMISTGGQVVVVFMAVFMLIVTLSMVLRFYTLVNVKKRKMRIDDYLIIVSYASLLVIEGAMAWGKLSSPLGKADWAPRAPY